MNGLFYGMAHSELELNGFFSESAGMYPLGDDVMDIFSGAYREEAPRWQGIPLRIPCCKTPCSQGALGYVINKIVHMDDVPSSKDAGDIGSKALIDVRPIGDWVQRDPCQTRELILGDQSYREKQGVAGDLPRSPWDRSPMLVYLAKEDGFHSIPAAYLNDGSA